MIYPCMRCGGPYETPGKRRTSRYCPDCRKLNARDKRNARDRERRTTRDDVLDVIKDYTARGMAEDYAAMMVDQYAAVADAEPYPDDWQVVGTDYFEGANAPAGPNEGRSSFFADLRDELDMLSDAAIFDPWWQHHPNWWAGMHDDGPIPAAAYAEVPEDGPHTRAA